MRTRKFVGIGVFLSLATGCAAGPKLADYPRRFIDRPYTLPKGVGTWNAVGVAQTEVNRETNRSYNRDVLPPLPLVWQQSLTDDLQLTYYLIPFVLNYQIEKAPTHYTGLQLAPLGLSFDTNDSHLNLGLEGDHRDLLTEWLALDESLTLAPDIHFGLGVPAWFVRLDVGPWFQPWETFAVGFKVGIRASELAVVSTTFNVANGSETAFVLTQALNWNAPLQVGFNWSPFRQFEVAGNFELDELGQKDIFTNEYKTVWALQDVAYYSFTLTLRHFY